MGVGVGIVMSVQSVKAQVSKMPAYPLITHNTYFSIWSNTDELNGSVTHHWTGKDQSMVGIVRVDKSFYRFMGEASPTFKTVLAAGDEDHVHPELGDPAISAPTPSEAPTTTAHGGSPC